ncbi:MAG: hypothetical protein NVSMB32_06090 [Actinomycetota bacterium]
MYCPMCRAEFVEGISRCPDDEVDLVEAETLPEDPDRPSQPVPIILSTEQVDLVVLPEDEVEPHFLAEDEVDPRQLPEDAVLVFGGPGQPPSGQPSAEFICSALEENEIAVFVTGEQVDTGSGIEVNPAGPVCVYVNQGNEARAREIVAEVVEGRPLAEEAPGAGPDYLDT